MTAPSDVDRDTLVHVAASASGRAVDDVSDTTVTPLGYVANNPTSEGVYLVRTMARSGNVKHPVAVVLKVCRAWPAADREPIAHELRERLLDVFRFEREAELYASGILEALPPGLAAPACFGIDRDEGRAALWLEYVEELGGDRWDLARFALAARHLGRFNGEYLAGKPLPTYPWLSRDAVATWSDSWIRRVPQLLEDEAVWSHPMVRESFPAASRETFRRLLSSRERWIAAMDRLPQTLSHLDAFRANLLSRHRAGTTETVAVDWSFFGIAAFGAEIAQLVMATLFYHGEPLEPTELAAASLDGYAAGLADAGYHVDQAALERAYAVNAIVRWALLLHPLAAVTRPEEVARRAASQRRPFEEIIALIARRTRYLFPLVTACEPLSVGRWTKSAHSPG